MCFVVSVFLLIAIVTVQGYNPVVTYSALIHNVVKTKSPSLKNAYIKEKYTQIDY